MTNKVIKKTLTSNQALFYTLKKTEYLPVCNNLVIFTLFFVLSKLKIIEWMAGTIEYYLRHINYWMIKSTLALIINIENKQKKPMTQKEREKERKKL